MVVWRLVDLWLVGSVDCVWSYVDDGDDDGGMGLWFGGVF